MSNTRHAPEGSPLAQHGFLSATQYVDMRGIQGAATAAKATTLDDPRARALIFFLQGLSMRRGVAPIAEALYNFLGEPAVRRSKSKWDLRDRDKSDELSPAEAISLLTRDLVRLCTDPDMLVRLEADDMRGRERCYLDADLALAAFQNNSLRTRANSSRKPPSAASYGRRSTTL